LNFLKNTIKNLSLKLDKNIFKYLLPLVFMDKHAPEEKEDEEGLPPLPGTDTMFPTIDDYYKGRSRNKDIQPLPAFPDSNSSNGFSDIAIKDAVEQESVFPQTETEQDSDSFYLESNIETPGPIPGTPDLKPAPLERNPSNEKKSIYVKLSKFQNARRSIDSIKEKLTDIENLLASVKQVKKKEEQEILGFEKEFESIRQRLHDISTDIFESPE